MPRNRHSSTAHESDRSKRLAKGMVFFVVALLLMGGVFWFLWSFADAQIDATSAEPIVLPPTVQQASQDQTPDKSKSDIAAANIVGQRTAQAPVIGEKDPPLQGPEAGQLVAPPSRNVTPNYQLSPLHQAQPLQRATGKTLPPPPDLPPLPLIFRKVSIDGPSTLSLKSKFQTIEVRLAGVTPPDGAKMCWHLGQKAPCAALGKLALTRFIRARAVGCLGLTKDTQKVDNDAANANRCFLGVGLKDRLLGRDDARVTDLASWMVRFGWVTPTGDRYSAEHQEARQLKRGLFAVEPTGNEQLVYDQLKKDSEELARAIEETAAGLTLDSGAAGEEDQSLSLFAEDAQEPDQIAPPPPVIQ